MVIGAATVRILKQSMWPRTSKKVSIGARKSRLAALGRKGEERSAVLEVFPIFGYRTGRYHLTANPSLEFSSEGEDRGWEFSPKLKLAYELAKGSHGGLEYHVDAGKLTNLAPRARRTETAYMTFDSRFAGQKFNLAMGRGTTNKSDRWVVRIGVEFDD